MMGPVFSLSSAQPEVPCPPVATSLGHMDPSFVIIENHFLLPPPILYAVSLLFYQLLATFQFPSFPEYADPNTSSKAVTLTE